MFSGIYDGSYQKGFIMKCIEEYFAIKKSHHNGATFYFGAGSGNRTHVASLEG